ncbi:CDP-4-dehydro-6-deoxy-D-gulose 4-reductase [Labrys miyagiensis]|uniref:CDP-4-dehydro-6-deoxy-D-gulose 4-reductase n=1 Tax=Labrys miyagiensis TaxID=346912 RepID=A0ABQ6CWD6_9HYPH|nr:NAD(P)-dependent oxidoreductase [Labrys miyagiensis]GLS23932.1 CDP-4-dehydro-6-deoxy-D-gulose 4-reductase [Labrys miyagiensis]
MRILVTGGTGFVGKWAALALVSAGHEVFVISRTPTTVPGCQVIVGDLLKSETIDAALARARPEILLHMAWYVEHGKFWNAAENLDWATATIRLVRAAQKIGVRRIVCAGTCMEYDLSSRDLCVETTTAIRPVTLYAVSKDSTRRIVEEFVASCGLEFAWGRMFFVFGPNEHPSRLVSSIAVSLLAGRPALISSGTQIRDFIDVHDAGEAFAALALSKVTGAVNIASGRALRIRELAEEIRAAAGGIGELRFGALPDRPNEPACIVADIRRLQDEVGYRPRKTIKERLSETLEWWRAWSIYESQLRA